MQISIILYESEQIWLIQMLLKFLKREYNDVINFEYFFYKKYVIVSC